MKIEANVNGKYMLFIFAVVFIVGGLFFTVAYDYNFNGDGTESAQIFGHSSNEMVVRLGDGENAFYVTLQDAIDANLFDQQIVAGTGLTGSKVEGFNFNSFYGSSCVVLSLDRSVRCTGYNNNMQLGLGGTDRSQRTKYTPNSVLIGGVSSIVGGSDYNCAIMNDKTVKCWGYNGYGQLGVGESAPGVPFSPVGSAKNAIIKSGSNLGGVVKMALRTGNSLPFSCALLESGKVMCSGYNGYGQLGTGDKINRRNFTEVLGITNAVDVRVGGHAAGGYACALLTDKTVKCWGYNANGQLGDGTTVSKSSPVAVSGLSNVEQIAVSHYDAGTTCALLTNGAVKCWGYNAVGAVGDGTKTSRSSPVDVVGIDGAGSATKATRVEIFGTVGPTWTCAIMNDKTVKCWGYNANGQLGDGTTVIKSSPVAVSGLSNVEQIAGTGWGYLGYACALLTDKTVKCWGYNANGQLGDGTLTKRTVPVTVMDGSSPLTDVERVYVNPGSGSFSSTCALLDIASTSTTNLKCWGSARWGQLGTDTPISTPNVLNPTVPA